MTDPDFDYLNPPVSPSQSGDGFFGLIVCGFILWAIVSFVRWIF